MVALGGTGYAATKVRDVVSCPAGWRVLGGGTRLLTSGVADVVIDRSFPSSATAFRGESRAIGRVAVYHVLLVTAICAHVVP